MASNWMKKVCGNKGRTIPEEFQFQGSAIDPTTSRGTLLWARGSAAEHKDVPEPMDPVQSCSREDIPEQPAVSMLLGC